MKFWFGSSRSGATPRRDRFDLEVDACLDLLAQAGRSSVQRAPDQTESILARVSAQVPLAGPGTRRLLTVRRAVAGGAIAAALALAAVGLHRWQDAAAMNGTLGASAPASVALGSTWDDINAALASLGNASQQASLLRPASLLMSDLESRSGTLAPSARAASAIASPSPWTTELLLPASIDAAPLRASAAMTVLRRVLPDERPAPLADRVAAELTGSTPGAAGFDPGALPR